MRSLRRLAVLLSVLGLLGLLHAARTRDIPRLSADALTPSMNFATVRAAGIMDQPARIHRRDGEVTVLTFTLRDDAAEWHVVAFGETARRLARPAHQPQPGDRVDLTAVVRFSSRYGPQLHVRSPDHVMIERAANGATP